MSRKILVRATVNLPKLKAGQTATVDPTVPYVARCLEAGLVVQVEKPSR